MKFKYGDRVAFYKPLGRFTGVVKMTPYMPYIIIEDKEGKEHRVHPKQCRILKETKYEIGDKVIVKPTWSQWFVEHMDVYWVPGHENKIPKRHLDEVSLHCQTYLNKIELEGEVCGFGNDESIRIKFDYIKESLILPEHLKKVKV